MVQFPARSNLAYLLHVTYLQPYLSHVIITHGTLLDRIDKLASDIRASFPHSTPHLLVVLKVGWDSFRASGILRSGAVRPAHTRTTSVATTYPESLVSSSQF